MTLLTRFDIPFNQAVRRDNKSAFADARGDLLFSEHPFKAEDVPNSLATWGRK